MRRTNLQGTEFAYHDGRPTLRHPEGEDELDPGDVVRSAWGRTAAARA